MRDAMPASAQDTVELRLASKGTELWPAVEAAQFARVVVHDEPGNEEERRAIAAFVDTLSEFTEAWERTPAENRSAFLNVLGDHVNTLEDLGLFVHWGCIERTLAAPGLDGARVPLAIISIDRERRSTVTVALPEELVASDDEFDPDE